MAEVVGDIVRALKSADGLELVVGVDSPEAAERALVWESRVGYLRDGLEDALRGIIGGVASVVADPRGETPRQVVEKGARRTVRNARHRIDQAGLVDTGALKAAIRAVKS